MADPTKDRAYQHPDWPWWTMYRAVQWIAREEEQWNGWLGDEDEEVRNRKLSAAEDLRVALANGRLTAFGITSENTKPEPIDSVDWATRKVYLIDWWMTDPYSAYLLKRADVQKQWPRDGGHSGRRSGRGRRKGVGSLESKDAPLIEEMRRLVNEEQIAPYAAATRLLDRAAGAGTDAAKRKRLVERYNERFQGD